MVVTSVVLGFHTIDAGFDKVESSGVLSLHVCELVTDSIEHSFQSRM